MQLKLTQRDPTATLAARLRSGSPLAKKLLDEERAHAAVNAGDDTDAIFFHFTGLKDAPRLIRYGSGLQQFRVVFRRECLSLLHPLFHSCLVELWRR